MRLALTFALLIASAAGLDAAPQRPPVSNSGSILLHARPRVWQPPSVATRPVAGMRLEPETGGAPLPDTVELWLDGAARRRALAKVEVQTRADGSSFAKLGGLARAYTVASIGPDGRLTQECVHSAEEALHRVGAATPVPHPATPAAPKGN